MTYPENRTPISWDDVQGVKHQNYSTWESEAKALRERVAELEKRLADCVVWMDTREKMVPGMPRLCDMARAALEATTQREV